MVSSLMELRAQLPSCLTGTDPVQRDQSRRALRQTCVALETSVVRKLGQEWA